MWLLVIIGSILSTAVITQTLVKAKVFLPFRTWVQANNEFFGEMIKCTYCTSHWVGGLLALMETWLNYSYVSLLGDSADMGYLISWFHPLITFIILTCTNIALASPVMAMIYHSHKTMVVMEPQPKEPNEPVAVKRVRII